MSLTEFNKTYKPFLYPWAVEMAVEHEKIHWIEDEVDLSEDMNQWKGNKLLPHEINHITQTLRLFTQTDVAVGNNYYSFYLPKFKNNEIRNMLGSFAAREGLHQRAYALLNDTLGLPDSDYLVFLEYAEMRDKIEFMQNIDNNTISGLALAVARSVFNEGVSLFASFVMLLNYQRYGKMKGMCTIVEWSIRDECNDKDTDVLTVDGFKNITEISTNDLVAQYSADGTIQFVNPSRVVKTLTNEQYIFTGTHFNHNVTPQHRMIYRYQRTVDKKIKERYAKDFKASGASEFILHGKKTDGIKKQLTNYERLLIAINADGHVRKRADGTPIINDKNEWYCVFSLKRQRKIDRLEFLLKETGHEIIKHIDSNGYHNFTLHIQCEADPKTFDWVKLDEITDNYGQEFICELMHWDGNVPQGGNLDRIIYVTKLESNKEKVQAISALSGYRCHVGASKKKGYDDCYRLSLIPAVNTRTTGVKIEKKEVVNEEMYCLTVPSGMFVMRRNDKVCITGNSMHVDGMTKLFREYCNEHPLIINDSFKKSVYQMARDIVMLEDKFIDLAYEMGDIEGLVPSEVKQYIRYITDKRLTQLGLKENFEISENPLPWVDWIVNGLDHSNFFEKRVSEYSAGGMSGEWGWEAHQ